MSDQAMEKRITELENQVTELTRRMDLLWTKGGFSRWDSFYNGGRSDVKNQYDRSIEKARKDRMTANPTMKSEVNNRPSPKEIHVAAWTGDPWKSSPPYEYKALNHERAEIRVLIFEGDSTKTKATGPIKCRLSICSLNERKEVMNLLPLSYTWGAPIFSETILIDGRPFKVTKNLYDAMDHFRASNTISELERISGSRSKWWIDAICINQQDPDERMAQVALMTRLYRSAHLVHVWLGKSTSDSDRAMDLIKDLADAPDALVWTKEPGKTYQYRGPGTLPEKLPNDPVALGDSEKERNYRAILDLFNRSWWSRVWIRQEVALPPDVRFHCGGQECSWRQLMEVASILSYLADHYHVSSLQNPALMTNSSVTSCFQKIEGLWHLRDSIGRQKQAENPYLPLRSAMFQARDSVSTDPRDKIYAMLPLIHPQETQLTADYRKPYQEVYKAAVLELASSSLNILSACQFDENTDEGSPHLPSWVPNMSKPWRFLPLLQAFNSDDSFRGTHDFRSESPGIKYIAEEDVLKTRGIIGDEVKMLHKSSASKSSSNAELKALREEWFKFYQQNSIPYDKRNEQGQLPYDVRYFWADTVSIWDWHSELNPQENTQSRSASSRTQVPYTSNISMYRAAFELDRASPKALAIRRAFPHYLMTGEVGDQLNYEENLATARTLFPGRRFARTTHGAFGFLPDATRIGDRICQFQGSVLTFVIRESNDRPGHWIMIGDAYFIWDINFLGGDQEPALQTIALV